MLVYTDHVFNKKEWVSVTSDEGRAVVVDGVPYDIIWMPKEKIKPCTEGEILPVNDEIDDSEAVNIIFGGVAE